MARNAWDKLFTLLCVPLRVVVGVISLVPIGQLIFGIIHAEPGSGVAVCTVAVLLELTYVISISIIYRKIYNAVLFHVGILLGQALGIVWILLIIASCKGFNQAQDQPMTVLARRGD